MHEADKGSKRSIKSILKHLESEGLDPSDVWLSMEKVIVKTLLAVQPYVAHTYKSCIPDNRDNAGFSCFDLLGFDVLLDCRCVSLRSRKCVPDIC